MAGEIVGSVEMLRRLVAFDTTSRNSNLALIDYVKGYLQEHGIASKLGCPATTARRPTCSPPSVPT